MKKTSFFSPDLPCLKNVCYERQAVTYQNYMTFPRQRVFRYYSIIVDWVSIVIDRFTFHMFFKRRKRMRCWMVRNPKGAFELGLSRSQYFFFSFISIFHHYHYHCYYYYHYIFSKIFNSIFCENSYRINDNQFFIRSSHINVFNTFKRRIKQSYQRTSKSALHLCLYRYHWLSLFFTDKIYKNKYLGIS